MGSKNAAMSLLESEYGSHSIVIYRDLNTLRDFYSYYIEKTLEESDTMVQVIPFYETEDSVKNSIIHRINPKTRRKDLEYGERRSSGSSCNRAKAPASSAGRITWTQLAPGNWVASLHRVVPMDEGCVFPFMITDTFRSRIRIRSSEAGWADSDREIRLADIELDYISINAPPVSIPCKGMLGRKCRHAQIET